jgi:hypothetical protein
MARTIYAVFESVFSAQKALMELDSHGLDKDRYDVFSRPPRNPAGRASAAEETLVSQPVKPEIREDGQSLGIKVGSGIASALAVGGALLVALGGVSLPALEPLLRAGALAGLGLFAAATGLAAAAGALVGGAAGGLIGLGIPEAELNQYARSVRKEPVVVAVLADWDSIDPIMEILRRNNPMELEERPYSRLHSGAPFRGAHASRPQAQPSEGENQ